MLSFMASDKVREMVGPRIALGCFALGLIFTGFVVARQLHRFEKMLNGYTKDTEQYLTDRIADWGTVTSRDEDRTRPSVVWDYGLGYVAFALFIGGCVAGGFSLFR